jgi:hypothetical protein
MYNGMQGKTVFLVNADHSERACSSPKFQPPGDNLSTKKEKPFKINSLADYVPHDDPFPSEGNFYCLYPL